MKVSVVLPTYNERHNIVELTKAILKQLPRSAECLIVDDDSPDGTGQLVKETFSQNKRVSCFVRKNHRGLGTAILYGLNRVKGETIIIMDSDFNHQPRYLPKFIKQNQTHDLVCGSRYLPGGDMPETPIRFWGSYIFNLYIRLLLHSPVKDSLSGFVSFSHPVLDRLSNSQKKAIFRGFGEWYIRFLWWAKQEKLIIKEIPVKYGSRLGDESKMNFAKSIIDYSKTVFNLKFLGLDQ